MNPLANRIRPRSLKDFVGQQHLVGPGKPLRKAIEEKHLFSFVLWGPPGTGKTTITRISQDALSMVEYSHESESLEKGLPRLF